MRIIIIAILALIWLKSVSHAIPNGQTDDSDQFTDVVHLKAHFKSFKYECSGLLISPRTVLTVTHCLRLGGEYVYDGMTVSHISTKGTLQAIVSKATFPKGSVEAGDECEMRFKNGPPFKTLVEFIKKCIGPDLAILTLNSDLPFTGKFRPVWDLVDAEAVLHRVPNFVGRFMTYSDYNGLNSKTREAESGLEAVIVGFGSTRCDSNYENCEGYGIRRFTKAEL